VADYDDQPALDWRKSRRSNSGGCLEIALDGKLVLLRDSKHPADPILSISPRAWRAFLERVRGSLSHLVGEFADVCQGVPRAERGIC